MSETVANTNDLLLIDWFSFSCKFDSFESAVDFIGFTQYFDSFVDCPGYNFYKEGIRFSNVTILRNNIHHPDSYFIEFSGRGCRAFEEFSCFTFSELFRHIYFEGFKLARIDLALDLRKSITINKFVSSYYKGYFKCRSNFTSIIRSDDNGSIGYSLYFGKQSSNTRLNIYDKRVERGYTNTDESWVRVELRLRHENANGLLLKYITESYTLGELFNGVLTNYLVFLQPNKNDSNKRRWKPARWWTNIIDPTNKISVFYRAGLVYDFSKFENDFFKQCGSRVKAYLILHSNSDLNNELLYRDINLNEGQILMLKEYYSQLNGSS